MPVPSRTRKNCSLPLSVLSATQPCTVTVLPSYAPIFSMSAISAIEYSAREFGISDLGFRISDLVFRISDFGFASRSLPPAPCLLLPAKLPEPCAQRVNAAPDVIRVRRMPHLFLYRNAYCAHSFAFLRRQRVCAVAFAHIPRVHLRNRVAHFRHPCGERTRAFVRCGVRAFPPTDETHKAVHFFDRLRGGRQRL